LSGLLSCLSKLLKQPLDRGLLDSVLLQLLLRVLLSTTSLSSATFSLATSVLTSFSALLLEIGRLVAGRFNHAKLICLLLVFTAPFSSMSFPSVA
jgi:hypothetical protein